jgi:hypothetical protein
MESAVPRDTAELHRLARREFRRLQHRQKLIVGCSGTPAYLLPSFSEDH